MKKIWNYIVRHKVIAIILAVVLVIVLVVVIQRVRTNANAASAFQTEIASRGTLTASIGATGTVRANQSASLTWQTSGTVEAVNVTTGQVVNAGSVLATLSQASLAQNIILAQADLVTAQTNLDSVIKSNTSLPQAEMDLVTATRNYNKTKANYDAMTIRRADQATIDNAEAQYILAEQRVEFAQKAYNGLTDRPEGDPTLAAAYSDLFAAQQAALQALGNWNWYKGKSTGLDLEELKAKLTLAQGQLIDAQAKYDSLKNGPDPKDIAAAQARVDAAQATLNMRQLAAPFAGTVTEVQPMPGDQITPGTVGFRIDDLSHLLVDVQVSEVDINSVKTGQLAVVTFDAVVGTNYHGKVTQVARAGDIVQGTVNFTVTVELTDADKNIKPGMTAAVIITVNELKDVLLVPNRAVRVMDGQRVVYVIRNGQTQEIPITLGASSDTVSEVLAGDLKAGDVVILNPPANFTPGGGGGRGMFGGGG